VAALDARRFKFIDESGSNLALTRLYGRAPAGERVCEGVPRNYGQQTSIISAVSLAGPSATFTVEGAVDTAVFDAYLEQVLRPTIEAGDVLILDNLSAHRASRIEAVAAECGASVLWLPHRTDVVEDQDLLAGGEGAHPRGVRTGAGRRSQAGHG